MSSPKELVLNETLVRATVSWINSVDHLWTMTSLMHRKMDTCPRLSLRCFQAGVMMNVRLLIFGSGTEGSGSREVVRFRGKAALGSPDRRIGRHEAEGTGARTPRRGSVPRRGGFRVVGPWVRAARGEGALGQEAARRSGSERRWLSGCRTNGSGGVGVDWPRRRQERFSERVARTPRPSAWRLVFFAYFYKRKGPPELASHRALLPE